MTGPEHYLEAERLIEVVDDLSAKDSFAPRVIGLIQAHATLALAAATGAALTGRESQEWAKACGTAPDSPNRGSIQY